MKFSSDVTQIMELLLHASANLVLDFNPRAVTEIRRDFYQVAGSHHAT